MTDESPSETAYNAAVAEEARVKAEARRQRILEKSRERMGIVTGAIPAAGIIQEEEEEEETETSSGTSRRTMQAMRRRRFQKTTAKETTTTNKEEEKATEDTITSSLPDDASSADTKKKYKGVAKMRREMIKKKTTTTTTTTTEESAVSTISLVNKKKPSVAILPIWFHFISVLFLLLAGMDIGWNQQNYSNVVIYPNLTPTTQGVGLVNRYMTIMTWSSKTNLSKEWQETLELSITQEEEEFVLSTNAQEEEDYIPNLDPLFQVDLDMLTEGKSGIFYTVARGAIYVHRLLLQIFYIWPIAVISTILYIPQQLVTFPPILCLLSLGIRQTATLVFGAKLPNLSSGKDKAEDVLGMMKQGVISFLTGKFPTIASLYQVWTHLRSDMYVILCGVFVGLAYSYPIVKHEMESEAGTDEL